MISHFEASNFKSLKEFRLDLRRFMVLVGPNGAGKTNLVRALEVFGEVLRRGTVEPIQEHGYDQLIRREKRPARAGLSFSLRTELPALFVERAISRILTVHKPKEPLKPQPPPVLEVGLSVTGSVHTDELHIAREVLRLISPQGTLEISSDERGISVQPGDDPRLRYLLLYELSGYAPYTNWAEVARSPSDARMRRLLTEAFRPARSKDVDPRLLQIVNWQRRPSLMTRHLRDVSQVTRLHLDASALRRSPSFEEARDSLGPTGEGLASAVARLRGPKPTPSPQFRKVLEALQEVYPRIEDVLTRRIPSGHLMLVFKERGISEELGQGSISDGVLHALALLVALHQGGGKEQPGLLAIEEPENAIHPWPLRRLIGYAQRSSRQILLTTHSETVVNAVTDPEALFIVENDDKRGTFVTQATERESALRAILQESGQRLGDVWLDGSLGGVPGAEP